MVQQVPSTYLGSKQRVYTVEYCWAWFYVINFFGVSEEVKYWHYVKVSPNFSNSKAQERHWQKDFYQIHFLFPGLVSQPVMNQVTVLWYRHLFKQGISQTYSAYVPSVRTVLLFWDKCTALGSLKGKSLFFLTLLFLFQRYLTGPQTWELNFDSNLLYNIFLYIFPYYLLYVDSCELWQRRLIGIAACR